MKNEQHRLPVWLAVALGAVTVIGAVGLAVALRGDGTPAKDDTKTAAEEIRSRATPSTTAEPVTDLPLVEPTTTTTTVTSPVVPSTTPPPAPCEITNDVARCGPGHWDSTIVNQDAHLTVSVDNPTPAVGEVVTFTFTWDDLDADLSSLNFCAPSSHDGTCTSSTSTCKDAASGVWPTPQAQGAHGNFTQQAYWDTAGTQSWSATLLTASSTYQALADAHPLCPLPDPYANRVPLSGVITVGA